MSALDSKLTASERTSMAERRDLSRSVDPPVWLRNTPAHYGRRECEAATEAVALVIRAGRLGADGAALLAQLTEDHRAALDAIEAVDVLLNRQSL